MLEQSIKSPALELPEAQEKSAASDLELPFSGNLAASEASSQPSLDLDNKLALASNAKTPPRSQKHEAAIVDLKNFISSVLSTKLDDIKNSVANKIQGVDEKKDGKGAKVKK